MKTYHFFILVFLFACSGTSKNEDNFKDKMNHDTESVTSKNRFIEWGKQNAILINSLNLSVENSDLETIAKAIGDAKLVVLSEGFHNCKEMMQFHHRLM